MGEKFSSKDFRTWAGTLVCACALARTGIEENDTVATRKRKLVAAIKETAATLGNTPAVCRGSYICPQILAGYAEGRTIGNYFQTLEDLTRFRGRDLHKAERSLLRFLTRTTR